MLYSPNDPDRNQQSNGHLDLPSLDVSFKAEIQSILRIVQQKRLDELKPDWIESIDFNWKNDTLYLDIVLAKKPPHKSVLPFIATIEEACGHKVEPNISAGVGLLKENKAQKESIKSKSHYRNMFDRTLPYGVELNHLRYYQERIGEQTVETLIPHLSGTEGKEEEIEQWRNEIERDYGVNVYPMRDWVSSKLKNILLDKFGRNGSTPCILDKRHIPALRNKIKEFHGRGRANLETSSEWKLDEAKLVDLTGDRFAFVTLDDPGTKDREDVLWAGILPDGKFELYIGIQDPTKYAYPGSSEDARVQLHGLTLYGRRYTVPTLPHQQAYDLSSFMPGKERRGLFAKFVFDADGIPISHTPEVIWGKAKSLGNIPPNKVYSIVSADEQLADVKEMLSPFATVEQASKARMSLYCLAQLLPGLKNLVKQPSGPQKVKGKGLGHQIVQYSMLTFKYTVAKWLQDNGRTFIASNQGAKDEELLRVLKKEFERHGMVFDPDDLKDPDKFRALHDSLFERKLYRLRDKLLNGRLGKTTFSPIVRGKQGVGVEVSANFKARGSDGLTNSQIAVALLNDLPPPYDEEELFKRAANAERKNNVFGALCSELCAYESILYRLSQIGQSFPFTVVSEQNGVLEIEVVRNRHRCVLDANSEDLLQISEARLVGYDITNDCYLFEPVYDRYKFAA